MRAMTSVRRRADCDGNLLRECIAGAGGVQRCACVPCLQRAGCAWQRPEASDDKGVDAECMDHHGADECTWTEKRWRGFTPMGAMTCVTNADAIPTHTQIAADTLRAVVSLGKWTTMRSVFAVRWKRVMTRSSR